MSIFLTMAVLDRRKTVLPFLPAAKSSKQRAEDTKTVPDHPAGFQIDPSFFEFDITLYFQKKSLTSFLQGMVTDQIGIQRQTVLRMVAPVIFIQS